MGLRTRKLLKHLGLLHTVQAVKDAVAPMPRAFAPCTPHLLIAVNRAFRECLARGTAEGGDYLEFGVFRGFTLWYAQALADDLGIRDMRFFGFDSFFGLPPPRGVDVGGEFREAAYYSSRRDTEAFLTQHGVDWSKTFLVEGWFEKTLTDATRTRYFLRRCSICVVDCDLYESARLVLPFIRPLVVNHTVILFDDWNNFGGDPQKGERRALTEFLARHLEIRAKPLLEFGGHGKGFLLSVRR